MTASLSSLKPEGLLADYIEIDSSQPVGGKTDKTALFLQDILDYFGANTTIFPSLGYKHNLLSELPGRTKSPIILLHHMDVVRAEFHQFMPKIENGYVWGRGAIDDKGLGIIHLLAFLRLAEDVKKHGVFLKRPVLFLAVADEEIAGEEGARFMINKLFLEAGSLYGDAEFEEPPLIFDEGGYWLSDLFKKPICNIAVAEKSQIVLKLIFKGKAGHGSVPPRNLKDDALAKAALAKEVFKEISRPTAVNEANRSVIHNIRTLKMAGFPLPLKVVADLASSKSDKVYALTHDTVGFTMQESDADINVIPSRVSQYLDIRIMPDTDPHEMLEFVKQVLVREAELSQGDDFDIEVVRWPLEDSQAPISSFDSEAMKIMKNVIPKYYPDALVTPSMCLGFTDSRWFRAIGCEAYGIVPVMFTQDEVDNIHGLNERMPIEGLNRGIEIMYEILQNLT